MTITIDLDPGQYRRLQEYSAKLGVSIEEFAREAVLAECGTPGEESKLDPIIEAAMEATFGDNRELYERLAK
jgi:hypothetical protein